MDVEAAVAEAVDNALAEILGLVRVSDGDSYFRKRDLERMIQDIRRNLRSDPGLYERLVAGPLRARRPRAPGDIFQMVKSRSGECEGG
jgi:hypothetical protein